MSQYSKSALLAILDSQIKATTEQADEIIQLHLANQEKRVQNVDNDISLLETYFKQVVRELRKGVTKEASRRVVETYKEGSAKPLTERIIKNLNAPLPTTVAPLRAKARAMSDVRLVVDAVDGDFISLTDAGRLGLLAYLPVLAPPAYDAKSTTLKERVITPTQGARLAAAQTSRAVARA